MVDCAHYSIKTLCIILRHKTIAIIMTIAFGSSRYVVHCTNYFNEYYSNSAFWTILEISLSHGDIVSLVMIEASLPWSLFIYFRHDPVR